MITISDVAREAGVSVATVSRALNDSNMVAREKKDHVLRVAKRLGYEPIRMTQARRARQKKIIAFITASFKPEMMDAMRDEAEQLGYDFIISYVGEGGAGYGGAMDVMRILPAEAFQGVAFMHTICRDEALWGELSSLWPNVQIGQSMPCDPMNWIGIDDRRASEDLTNYLLGKGYRRIAYVNTPDIPAYQHVRDRLAGYRYALSAAGIAFDEDIVFSADHTIDGGRDLARSLLRLPSLPDAVMAGHDLVAIGCIGELMRSGVRVPDDIAVTGFDGMEQAELYDVPVTTVVQPFPEMGKAAVQLLSQLTSERVPGRRVIVEHQVVPRESA